MSDLLTDNEIEALISEVNEDDSTSSIFEDNYELYDITSGMHRVKGWTQDVKNIDERIQSNLKIKLLGILHKSVEVKRQEIKIEKFSSYVQSLNVPTSINVYSLTGMFGYSAITISADLLHALVNIFFGGGSRPTKTIDRDFTETENRVVKLVLTPIIDAIRGSWKELADIEFIPVESVENPDNLSTYKDNDVLMISPFTINFSVGGGEVQLVMPGTVIDSIFRNKQSQVQRGEMSSKDIMKERVMEFDFDVTGELTGASLTIGEIFKLKEGDIIPVDSPDEVDLKVNGVTKNKAKMGEISGKVGLKI